MVKLPLRHSSAGLTSALAVLEEAVKRHADSPERVQEAVDRVAFRIRGTEDLFQFCPSHGELPLGGGTIWGLICQSPPLVAGVLVRRLLVERLGDELELAPGHVDNVLFALEESPENIALLEIVGRCPALRAEYCAQPSVLGRAVEALQTLRSILAAAPAARVQTDRGLVGLTSGLHGVRDSHAFFAEPDLLRAIVEVLLAPECRGLPAAAAAEGGSSAAALRRLCVLTMDFCGQLRAHPTVVARCLALLSSALPHAFGSDKEEVNVDLWVLVHMLASSECSSFIEEVLSLCSRNRLHDAGDLEALGMELFGRHRPEDSRRRGRAFLLGDVRLALCHVLLLLFHVLELLHHQAGQPERFPQQAVALLRTRVLPALRGALEGGVAGRWPAVREALGALASASERAPLPLDECEWLRGARLAFRSFASSRFVPAEGLITAAEAEAQLDPFGHLAAAPPAPRSARSLCLPAERPSPPRPSAFPEPASPAAASSALTPRAAADRDRGRLPLGSSSASPRRQVGKLLAANEASSGRLPPNPSELDPRGALPRPLPFSSVPDRAEGSLTATLAAKRGLQRLGLPPLAGRPRGSFPRSAGPVELVA